ncbi:MAG: FAD-dependent oxidoreductase [Clostridia bacterium]
MQYDVIIIGAGPAGIFTALELLRKDYKGKIVIVEKGKAIENRHCPKSKTNVCVNCKPYCHITTGFSGAGAFSDGKLSLSSEVGGQLPELIGDAFAQEMINYTDKIYLEFGADTHIEGLSQDEEVKEIRTRAIWAGLKLVDCPIRHLGTEKAQEIYLAIEKYLLAHGVEILFGYQCENILLDGAKCCGVIIDNGKDHRELRGTRTVIATGRRGAEWLENLCAEHNILHEPGTVDIGVRVEVRNEVMEKVNRALYESKLIGYPQPFKNKVRTFCQNPGGFVSQENYDNDLAVVNGHSYKELKSPNTNLAILCSHNFCEPFNQPIAYAQKIGELTNMLGNGHILVQRFGDIIDGKRTWTKELSRSNVKPTLPDAVAGDITSAMPYRTMINIINFIQALDQVVPGFASDETLLYSPELKFYSNKVKMDQDFNTSIAGLHCLGDSSGWTRGLMMASVMGVIMSHKILSSKTSE